MRIWETVFVLLQLPVWARLVLGRSLGRRLGALVPLIWLAAAAAVLGLHLVVEGWRWQTVPALGCFAAGAWLAARGWMRRHDAVAGTFRRRTGWRALVRTGLRTVGGALLLALLALPWMLPVPRLEASSGPYAVGTRMYQWTDSSRQDFPAPGREGQGRELLVQFWYPSSPRGDEEEAPYVPEPELGELEKVLREAAGLPSFLAGYLKLAHTGVYAASPLPESGGRYPVVVFCHGWPGFGFTYHYLMAGLAARGYVVAGIDMGWAEHRTQSPAEADLPAWDRWIDRIWAPDERFVLDKLEELNRRDPDGVFTGRLALDQVAVAGHSFGGDAALAALGQDKRFRAAVSLDGAFYGRSGGDKLPEQKMLRIATEKTALQPDLPRPDEAELQAAGLTAEQYVAYAAEFPLRMKNLERDSPPLVIPGVSHSSFSDVYLFSPFVRMRDRGPDLYRIHAQVLEAVVRFLENALR